MLLPQHNVTGFGTSAKTSLTAGTVARPREPTSLSFAPRNTIYVRTGICCVTSHGLHDLYRSLATRSLSGGRRVNEWRCDTCAATSKEAS
jgi:hypothetical protein